jgi:hypothetical protein
MEKVTIIVDKSNNGGVDNEWVAEQYMFHHALNKSGNNTESL